MHAKGATIIVELLRDLQMQVLTRMEKGDQQDLRDLSVALAELEEAAIRLGDLTAAGILDDLGYVVNHTLMGVHFKAAAVLPDIEAKLQAMEGASQAGTT